jgi:hypothetical protein
MYFRHFLREKQKLNAQTSGAAFFSQFELLILSRRQFFSVSKRQFWFWKIRNFKKMGELGVGILGWMFVFRPGMGFGGLGCID